MPKTIEELRAEQREKSRRYRLAHPDKCKERRRQWMLANPDKVREKQRRYRERHREAGKQRAMQWRQSDRGRDWGYRDRFGISLEEYEALLRAQGGICAICGAPPRDVLRVDHCHETGRIRGLLCQNCNSGIGMLRDDPALVEQALSYLLRTSPHNASQA